ncbi:PDZ domain-containing protein 8-like [Mytilus edulis]|uniref:PDZ domain-containing protein 8-like n=1 Tax=Mytilus edulis TaxID=6550 RepID=UPI0039EE0599
MLVALCLASFIIGVVVTILIQTFVIRRRLLAIPVEPISHKPQFCQYKLPKELLAVIHDQDQKGRKESCIALNLVIQFLFKELRDTNRVRRWVTKKMNIEFNDMLQSTTGKLIEKITLRDFNLGPTFPVINCVAVDTVKLSEDESLEELDIMADLDYTGGFQLAIEIDLVFKKWAYLSVTVTKLKGIGRLQFTRNPYTHWSFTFYEDPVVEFEVESKFGGRPVPQVTSLIISQIKRILRKRHTLPHYKMRYKPFFIPPDESYNPKDISLKGNLIGEGQLEVKVINCSSLLVEQAERYLFCTLSVDKLRWLEYEELRKKVWVVYEVKIIKGPAQSIGLTFKDDFMLEKYEDVVVVDNVTPNSPASATDIRKGDVLVSVGMTRITSVKQAGKILRNVNDSVMLRLERAKTGSSEDYIKVQDSESSKIKDPAVKDDYINIVIKPCDSDDKQRETENSLSSNQITRDRRSLSTPSSPHRKVLSLVTTGKEYLRRRVKSHTVSEGSVSMTTTSQSELNIPKSPTGHRISKSMDSRQLTRSINGQEEEEDDQPSELPIVTQSGDFIKNRTNSDPGFVLLNSDDSASEDEEEDQDPTSKEQEVKSLPPDGVSIKSEDVEKLGLADMKKTKEVKAQQNPNWNEDFVFYTSPEDKYLNVCVWCRVPPKLDKHEKVIKPGRETLIGHISLPLADISLDCLLTIQRDSQRCVNLVPPENIAGVSRTKFQEYMSHQGFDHRMCHGDITLGFKYGSSQSGDTERRVPEVKVISDKESSEEFVSLPDSLLLGQKSRLEIGKHDFTATQFTSATYCHFCGKKIWLKDAFLCCMCSMICHKKCVVRCQTQTLCTKDGAMMRSNPKDKWKAPIPESRKRQGHKSGAVGILSKFRKDPNVENKTEITQPAPSPQPSPKPSPQPSPQFMRRRNSAPGTDDDKCGSFLDITNIPQTRSSTSIQTLLNTGVLPRRLSEELFGSKYRGDSSEDSDSESSLLQLSKQRAKGQNLDEMVVTAAKEMGKELYAELSLEERKEKLDTMVSKLQKEIDIESENKTEMIKEEMESVDSSQKEALQLKISKSDEKVEALMMMMLHYCAGLQYCLEEEEEERRKGKEKDKIAMLEQTIEVQKLTEQIHKEAEQSTSGNKMFDSIESSSSDSTSDNIRSDRMSSSLEEKSCEINTAVKDGTTKELNNGCIPEEESLEVDSTIH